MRLAAVLLAIATCASGLLLWTAQAEEPTAEPSPDAAYEAKKAAYREKLMADDVTTYDILIGSWVSCYSCETDSYEDQLDQMAAAGI